MGKPGPLAESARLLVRVYASNHLCAPRSNTYFDWKSAGVYYSHRASGMPGPITRLLACSDEQRKVYPQRGLDMGPTFIHPNYMNNPHNGESSGSYNKPAAVMHWTAEADIKEEYVLYIDADMILRAPIDPTAMGAKRGMVVSEHVGYLEQGIRNKLVENFIPKSAVPLARAAGWYHIFHREVKPPRDARFVLLTTAGP